MKPAQNFKLREAETEAADARAWFCKSCTKMIEDGAESDEYCKACKDYWDDYRAGIFQ